MSNKNNIWHKILQRIITVNIISVIFWLLWLLIWFIIISAIFFIIANMISILIWSLFWWNKVDIHADLNKTSIALTAQGDGVFFENLLNVDKNKTVYDRAYVAQVWSDFYIISQKDLNLNLFWYYYKPELTLNDIANGAEFDLSVIWHKPKWSCWHTVDTWNNYKAESCNVTQWQTTVANFPFLQLLNPFLLNPNSKFNLDYQNLKSNPSLFDKYNPSHSISLSINLLDNLLSNKKVWFLKNSLRITANNWYNIWSIDYNSDWTIWPIYKSFFGNHSPWYEAFMVYSKWIKQKYNSIPENISSTPVVDPYWSCINRHKSDFYDCYKFRYKFSMVSLAWWISWYKNHSWYDISNFNNNIFYNPFLGWGYYLWTYYDKIWNTRSYLLSNIGAKLKVYKIPSKELNVLFWNDYTNFVNKIISILNTIVRNSKNWMIKSVPNGINFNWCSANSLSSNISPLVKNNTFFKYLYIYWKINWIDVNSELYKSYYNLVFNLWDSDRKNIDYLFKVAEFYCKILGNDWKYWTNIYNLTDVKNAAKIYKKLLTNDKVILSEKDKETLEKVFLSKIFESSTKVHNIVVFNVTNPNLDSTLNKYKIDLYIHLILDLYHSRWNYLLDKYLFNNLKKEFLNNLYRSLNLKQIQETLQNIIIDNIWSKKVDIIQKVNNMFKQYFGDDFDIRSISKNQLKEKLNKISLEEKIKISKNMIKLLKNSWFSSELFKTLSNDPELWIFYRNYLMVDFKKIKESFDKKSKDNNTDWLDLDTILQDSDNPNILDNLDNQQNINYGAWSTIGYWPNVQLHWFNNKLNNDQNNNQNNVITKDKIEEFNFLIKNYYESSLETLELDLDNSIEQNKLADKTILATIQLYKEITNKISQQEEFANKLLEILNSNFDKIQWLLNKMNNIEDSINNQDNPLLKSKVNLPEFFQLNDILNYWQTHSVLSVFPFLNYGDMFVVKWNIWHSRWLHWHLQIIPFITSNKFITEQDLNKIKDNILSWTSEFIKDVKDVVQKDIIGDLVNKDSQFIKLINNIKQTLDNLNKIDTLLWTTGSLIYINFPKAEKILQQSTMVNWFLQQQLTDYLDNFQKKISVLDDIFKISTTYFNNIKVGSYSWDWYNTYLWSETNKENNASDYILISQSDKASYSIDNWWRSFTNKTIPCPIPTNKKILWIQSTILNNLQQKICSNWYIKKSYLFPNITNNFLTKISFSIVKEKYKSFVFNNLLTFVRLIDILERLQSIEYYNKLSELVKINNLPLFNLTIWWGGNNFAWYVDKNQYLPGWIVSNSYYELAKENVNIWSNFDPLFMQEITNKDNWLDFANIFYYETSDYFNQYIPWRIHFGTAFADINVYGWTNFTTYPYMTQKTFLSEWVKQVVYNYWLYQFMYYYLGSLKISGWNIPYNMTNYWKKYLLKPFITINDELADLEQWINTYDIWNLDIHKVLSELKILLSNGDLTLQEKKDIFKKKVLKKYYLNLYFLSRLNTTDAYFTNFNIISSWFILPYNSIVSQSINYIKLLENLNVSSILNKFFWSSILSDKDIFNQVWNNNQDIIENINKQISDKIDSDELKKYIWSFIKNNKDNKIVQWKNWAEQLYNFWLDKLNFDSQKKIISKIKVTFNWTSTSLWNIELVWTNNPAIYVPLLKNIIIKSSDGSKYYLISIENVNGKLVFNENNSYIIDVDINWEVQYLNKLSWDDYLKIVTNSNNNSIQLIQELLSWQYNNIQASLLLINSLLENKIQITNSLYNTLKINNLDTMTLLKVKSFLSNYEKTIKETNYSLWQYLEVLYLDKSQLNLSKYKIDFNFFIPASLLQPIIRNWWLNLIDYDTSTPDKLYDLFNKVREELNSINQKIWTNFDFNNQKLIFNLSHFFVETGARNGSYGRPWNSFWMACKTPEQIKTYYPTNNQIIYKIVNNKNNKQQVNSIDLWAHYISSYECRKLLQEIKNWNWTTPVWLYASRYLNKTDNLARPAIVLEIKPNKDVILYSIRRRKPLHTDINDKWLIFLKVFRDFLTTWKTDFYLKVFDMNTYPVGWNFNGIGATGAGQMDPYPLIDPYANYVLKYWKTYYNIPIEQWLDLFKNLTSWTQLVLLEYLWQYQTHHKYLKKWQTLLDRDVDLVRNIWTAVHDFLNWYNPSESYYIKVKNKFINSWNETQIATQWITYDRLYKFTILLDIYNLFIQKTKEKNLEVSKKDLERISKIILSKDIIKDNFLETK